MQYLGGREQQLREKMAKLEEELAMLRETVSALVARNIDAKPSRSDSSADGHRYKKPGRRNGHEGKARKKPDRIDTSVTIDRKECARCGSHLSRPTGSYERIV
ncbi:MAG: hypothetical protein QXE82_01940 [Candidatus Nitrosotenuis sp.]